MTFSWSHFLSLAGRLANSATQESERRAAIGRAYYAAYCTARDFAVTRGLQYSGNKPSHEQVWQFFRNAPSSLSGQERRAYKHIGDNGLALREQRTLADYKPFQGPPVTIDDATVRKALSLSRGMLERLQKLS